MRLEQRRAGRASRGRLRAAVDPLGQARGAEFAVNVTTAGTQIRARAAASATGFVVVWSSLDSSHYGVFARRYDTSGNPLSGELQVNTVEAAAQIDPDVASGPGGEFVVVWAGDDQDGDGAGIFAQRFDASGNPAGDEFQVNVVTADHQRNPAVAVGTSGAFVVVWESRGQDGSDFGVRGRRYDAGGAALGDEFQVNSYTLLAQDDPDVAVDGAENFVVVWRSMGQDGSGAGVYGQRFDAAGLALGAEFRANTATTMDEQQATVAREPDGDFVVAWTTLHAGAAGYDIFAQRFDGAGAKFGAEFVANTVTYGGQRYPSVAALRDESFVMAWSSEPQDGSATGVFARLYSDLIFQNGFNAGP